MTGQRKSPSSVQFADIADEGLEGVETFDRRLERYSRAHKRSQEMAAYLSGHTGHYSVGDRDAIKSALHRINVCGDWLEFHHYFTVDQYRLAKASFCMNHWVCPLCAIRRGAKTLEAYTNKWEYLSMQDKTLRPFLVTLTVKNGDNLEERMDHLKNSMSSLMQRRRQAISTGWGQTIFQHVVGGVGSYEVTNKGNGWHPHCHMIALAGVDLHKYQAQLAQEWHDITGDSFIVDIRPMQNHEDPAKDFSEVFKYAVKFSDLTLEQNVDLWLSLRGSRMMFSFGAFWGVKVPTEWTDDLLDGFPYIKLMYTYLNGKYRASKHNTGEILINDTVIHYEN